MIVTFLPFTPGTVAALENIVTKNGNQKTENEERLIFVNKTAKMLKYINNNRILWEVFPRIDGNKYVITSAVNVPLSGPETYMFAADENGDIVSFFELPGSYRGGLEHKKCFDYIGYDIDG